jgi:toxin HigB-1
MPIAKIKHKGLKELFETGKTARINKRYHETCIFIMDFLDNVTDLSQCSGIQNFHELKGSRKGEYSMHASGNWCITFEWEQPDILILNFEDYH